MIYDDELLLYLRENFLVAEFWNKSALAQKVFGLAKIPLHQFYLAYRNLLILKYLAKNKASILLIVYNNMNVHFSYSKYDRPIPVDYL